MSQHLPRKRFGQHFLHDEFVIQKIINAIAPQPTDHIVEIGPGLGALTCPLLQSVNSLDVIEIDRDVIPHLLQNCGNSTLLHVHQADVLRFDFAILAEQLLTLRVTGNLPYNISTPLLFHLLNYTQLIRDMHFMVQNEVADRLGAKPGTHDYGRLSVMIQYRCEVKKLFVVSPGSFTPPPKVHSAVVRLVPKPPATIATDEKLFGRIVAQAFSQRRKMLHNTLKDLITVAQIEALGINPQQRPETLALEDFVKLSNLASNDLQEKKTTN